jgi:hypothetical protein
MRARLNNSLCRSRNRTVPSRPSMFELSRAEKLELSPNAGLGRGGLEPKWQRVDVAPTTANACNKLVEKCDGD